MFAVSQSQNAYHLLKNRELGTPFSKNFKDQYLIRNMSEGNYKKTIFNGHDSAITALDIKNYLTATLSFNDKIKLWNLETGKCLWTFDPNPKWRCLERIKIVEDSLICSGIIRMQDQQKYNNVIRIVSLQTGLQTAIITDSRLETDRVCTIGRQLFCALNDGNIGEWDFEGKFIRLIQSRKINELSVQLLGMENFLVHFGYNIIVIHNIVNNTKRELELTFEKRKMSIIHAFSDGNSLICGFSRSRGENSPDCCVLDLESGIIISQYQATGAFVHTEINYKNNETYLTDSGTVWRVIIKEEWAYLGHSTGKVVAVDLARKKHFILGQHDTGVDHLVEDGQILVSGSSRIHNHNAQLKLWDLKSRTKIAEIELPILDKIAAVSGKVLAVAGESLIQWDYLSSPKPNGWPLEFHYAQ